MNNLNLTKLTGDPFADVGGYVIKYLMEENGVTKGKSIEKIIEWMTEKYVTNWSGKLNAFFLNSTITQPAFKGERKVTETIEYFRKLINDELPHREGYCRISGEKTKLFSAGRDNHILSGSGTFINFHASHEGGLAFSKEMIIRSFFVPFGLQQLNDKIALIYSNYPDVTWQFIKENCESNIRRLNERIDNTAGGVLVSDYKNPANALFRFASDCISEAKIFHRNEETGDLSENVTLNLLHFTNFGASPEVVLYTIPATVFRFYSKCFSNKNKQDWKRFVSNHYTSSKFKDAHFNDVEQTWENKKEKVDFETYKSWKNLIYENLLHNKSILRFFLKWSVKNKIRFEIIELYQILVRKMDVKAVKKLKELADFIVVDNNDDYIKKACTKINGLRKQSELRRYLVNLAKDNVNSRKHLDVLWTIDDYVEYLFPDGSDWREVRDLLLIAIYQKIHELDKKIEIEVETEEQESPNS
ncbi:MAG: type I-B CRISPR-associated protein Cas8b1/Cst1 [Saprospiraceae bacterium]|nr:type I-B CRISPR-associated protein Cas8b1/Cst1 [Saprospiraceae bacterium]